MLMSPNVSYVSVWTVSAAVSLITTWDPEPAPKMLNSDSVHVPLCKPTASSAVEFATRIPDLNPGFGQHGSLNLLLRFRLGVPLLQVLEG